MLCATLTLLTLLPFVTGTPPHIIFIVADDLGWNDVGWHNDAMYTPNLDHLAYRGVILNSSYVQPSCTPSRGCFMTGYYPFHTGLQHRVFADNRPHYLRANFTTLPQKLKQLGYATHMVGKWHLGFCNWNVTPTYRGFDSFMGFYSGDQDYYEHTARDGYDFRFNETVYHPPKGEYSAHIIASRAIDIINVIDPVTQPLYLYLPFQSVHQPIEVPVSYEARYANITAHSRRTYCGMVSALDEAVGNITAALRRRGFMDNALLVFTTDNGGPTYTAANNLPLRGSKTTLWEGGTKGAAFVYSDTLLQKTGYLNHEMIHAVDWFPTLLTLAGGKPDAGMDGMNLLETVRSGAPSNRTEFVYNIDEIEHNAAIRYVTVYNIDEIENNTAIRYVTVNNMVEIKENAAIMYKTTCNINDIAINAETKNVKFYKIKLKIDAAIRYVKVFNIHAIDKNAAIRYVTVYHID